MKDKAAALLISQNREAQEQPLILPPCFSFIYFNLRFQQILGGVLSHFSSTD